MASGQHRPKLVEAMLGHFVVFRNLYENARKKTKKIHCPQWRSQKFSTGGALIGGFSSYPHNPLLIYLTLRYKIFQWKVSRLRIMRKIRLDDSCLNHLTNVPVGFTRKSSYIHTFWEITYQKYYVFCWLGCVRTWRNLHRYATGYVLYSYSWQVQTWLSRLTWTE